MDKRKRKIILKVLIFFLFFLVVIIISSNVNASELHVGWDQTYTFIQDAINNSNNGDTVIVHNGTYYENLTVNKSIELVGYSATNTTIWLSSDSIPIIHVVVNEVDIYNLKIKDGSEGIYIQSSLNYFNVTNCNITNSHYRAIYSDSGNLTIDNCTIWDRDIASGSTIDINYCDNFIIRDTNVLNCLRGLWLDHVNEITIENCNIDYIDSAEEQCNYFTYCDYINVTYSSFSYSWSFVDITRFYHCDYVNVDNCSFIMNDDPSTYAESMEFLYCNDVYVIDCYFYDDDEEINGLYFYCNPDNSIVDNCTFEGLYYGIRFHEDNDVEENLFVINSIFKECSYGLRFLSDAGKYVDVSIEDNNFTENVYGLEFTGIQNVLIKNNSFWLNDYAFRIKDRTDANVIQNVTVYNNYINSSTGHIYDNGIQSYTFNNISFNITKTLGANIIDGSYLGGNFWNDYDGEDTDGDGLGDTDLPFNSSGQITIGGDYHPLVYGGAVCDVNAYFVYNPKIIYPRTVVTFTDYSTGTISSWHWRFGDGSTGVGKNQKHSYDDPGTYTVILTVYGSESTCSDNMSATLKVIELSDWQIIPPMPPRYPDYPYTIPQMYDLLNVQNLSRSDARLRIVFIDTGYTPRVYQGIDLSRITGLTDPDYNTPADEHGHGTWISYALAYIIQTKLPNAELISYKLFNENGGCTAEQLMYALNKVEALHPDIISFSGGGLGNPNDAFAKKIENLRQKGIIVVVAAGNSGPASGTILSPACSRGAWAVGAIDPMFTIKDLRDDIVCDWSSRGPVSSVYPKPDYTSPGESIIGPWKLGEEIVSGTSMATPLIAGGTAVILGNNKLLADIVNMLYFWDNQIIPSLVDDSIAESVFGKTPVNSYGYGIPDFNDACGVLFWKLIFLIIVYILVIVISITVIAVIWRLSKKKEKRKKLPQTLKSG